MNFPQCGSSGSSPRGTLKRLYIQRYDPCDAERCQCIAEVKSRADLLGGKDHVEAIDGVMKSDTAIREDLRQQLCQTAAPLEDLREVDKDWHPGSQGQVLNLVHPSLYPLVYGQSRILPKGILKIDECFKRCGHGVIVTVPSEEDVRNPTPRGRGFGWPKEDNLWSRKFQWLPSEFLCPEGIKDVK